MSWEEIHTPEIRFSMGMVAAQNNIEFQPDRTEEWKQGWLKADAEIEVIRKMSDQEFILHIKQKNLRDMQKGVELGWWESLDARGEPIPFAKIVKLSELSEHENTMAHIMAKLGVFDSVNTARKNGWNKPITHGEFWVKKKTVRIKIEQ